MIICLSNINRLIFVIETDSVLCEECTKHTSKLDRFQASNWLTNKVHRKHNRWQYTFWNTMKPPYTGTTMNCSFFIAGRFLFLQVLEVLILGTPHPGDCKGFMLKTGFFYALIPFNTGFTAYTTIDGLKSGSFLTRYPSFILYLIEQFAGIWGAFHSSYVLWNIRHVIFILFEIQ